MIDVVAVLFVVAIVGLGSRYLASDQDQDTHNVFCLGICTHVDEQTEEHDPNEPCGEDHEHE